MEATGAIKSRFQIMEDLLKENQIPYYEDDVTDYMQMFEVICGLCDEKIEVNQAVPAFAKLSKVMEDEKFITSRDKMRKMYNLLDEISETNGLLERKHKLFFGFGVYVAYSIISEKDDKRHHLMGVAEFESEDYIKYKMEEYWAVDPYMFSFAFN